MVSTYVTVFVTLYHEVRASQLAQASERVDSPTLSNTLPCINFYLLGFTPTSHFCFFSFLFSFHSTLPFIFSVPLPLLPSVSSLLQPLLLSSLPPSLPVLSCSEFQGLQEEIRLHSHLQHKNIVRYCGARSEDGVFKIFMEQVPGGMCSV